MKTIALIPARRGSKRLSGKNMALLNGFPLLWYAIRGAKDSGIFDEIVVSTDWADCVQLAENMGVNVLLRPDALCTDMAHDYEWVRHALGAYPGFDIFVILRPTSPFRTGETIKRAMAQFLTGKVCDSLRAVEPTKAHPGKSWILRNGNMMDPYTHTRIMGFPSHDMATQSLIPVHCQNGCIHIAWVKTLEGGNYSGRAIKGFLTEGNEGIDINTEQDLQYAEWLMRKKG